MRAYSRGGRLLACLVWVFVLGCGGGQDGPAPRQDLEAIPHPELSTAEPAVVRQLEALRQTLDSRLDDATTARRPLTEAYRQLGERYQAYDLVDAAAPCYRNALHLEPEAPRVHYLLGVLARREGEHETAVSHLRQAIDGDSGNLAARLHLAFVQLAMGQAEGATATAQGVLEEEPHNAAAQVIAGQAAMSSGDTETAIAAFERALEAQPGATRVHYLLAQAYRKQGDLDAARRHLEQQGPREVAFADPISASLYIDLAGSAAIMQRAAGAKVAGFLEASVESYRQAVANAPASPEARRDLGALLAQTGQLDAAADQYKEARRLEPDKALNHFSLALVLEAAGRPDQALESFRVAVAKEPEYREFRLVLAERLASAGQLEEAREHFDRLLEQDPRDANSRLERARVNTALGDATTALADARQVAEGDAPTSLKARAFHLQGDLAARQGQPSIAKGLLEQALALDPELADAHYSLGTLAGMAGDFETARQRFRRVTESTPQRAAAWLGEATALVLLGREAEAAQRLEEGLQALPEQGSLAFTLARLHLAAEDPAVRDGARALALAEPLFRAQATPEHAEVMASALAAVGRQDEAIALYRQLLDQLPSGSDPALGARWRSEIERLTTSTR